MLCRSWLVSCLAAASENLPSPPAVGDPAIHLSSYRPLRPPLRIVLPLLAFPLVHTQTPTLVSIAVTSAKPSIPGQFEQLMWQASGSANLTWGWQQQRAALRWCLSYQERSI